MNFSKLEETIKYSFKDKSLLENALTHSSYANEACAKGMSDIRSNERLEFLGDSVLSLISSTYLYDSCPSLPEGELSKLRAQAVCEKALADFAREISLGSYILLGHGEASNNGAERDSILSDAFEALLAAIYLDSSVETVRTFLLPFISEKIKETIEGHTSTDYKTMLQQLIQREDGEILDYVLVGESGPAHPRVFEIEARLGSNVIGKGSGRSKRRAEQSAAKEALLLFGAIEK